ncbi:MAG TPA: hypothetical protein VFU22_26315 [Roseiflexaceae bacterium]|nr:hypothetical protein [Roseiflexaceae bacterium]
MPDPKPATYRLFSWMRQGLLAGMTNPAGASSAPGHLVLPMRLRINSTRDVDVPLQLYGPGDITGLDAREVIRIEPQHLMTDFEPNYFPLIEFDRPDFPWLFTPALPDGDRRLRPWICLVVVLKEQATLTADADRPLPVLECPRRELPDLAEAWAWAHVQIVSDATMPAGPLNHEALKQALKHSPELTLSRLLAPRRLDPNTAYYACLVPTYEVGRKAGLGEPVTPEDEQAISPAWASGAGVAADDRAKLPVYFHWEFSTGLAGDFEALARRLLPQPLPATVGLRPIDLSSPGWGMPDTSGAVLDLGGALETPETEPRPWPDEARAAYQQDLRDILNAPATHDLASPEPALLAPPLYGQWYANQQIAPTAGDPPHWFGELNLDPRNRVAAGLGTLVIRYEQEQLMASAWDQLAQQEQDNQRLKQAQLAETVGEALVDKHLKALQPERFLQVTGPVRAALGRGPAGAALMASISRSTLGQPAVSAAFRRLTRSNGPVAKRMDRISPAGDRTSATVAAGVHAFGRPPATAISGAQATQAMILAQLDPKVTVLEAVRQDMPAAESTELIRFAPEFPQPMYEPLRDYFQDMLLPGIDQVPHNTIALLQTNQQFIESYMLGLNHEMSRELLWRGYPTDRRGTYFRQFWDVRGRGTPATPAERERLTDITAIASWADESHLGDHASRGDAEGHMVLLIRGDLLGRYPRAIIYAVEAVWSEDRVRRELGTTELYPMFRATQAPDITMLGFLLTEQQVRGDDDATNDGHPGWFFVLQEQPTEPRFGLDVATSFGGLPQHWRDLSWGHLAPDEAALQQIAYVPIDGLMKNAVLDNVAWGRNSAQMATITRQRPFRVAIHARTWLSGQPKEHEP